MVGARKLARLAALTGIAKVAVCVDDEAQVGACEAAAAAAGTRLTVLVEIDAQTLRVRRRIYVADHLGCVAASGRTLVAGNWDSELLYVFDLTGPVRVHTVPNPSATHFQDMKFVGNQLVAGGNLTWWNGTVDWIDWPSRKVTRSLRAGAIGPLKPFGNGGPYTGEGMAIVGRELYVIPEDGPSRVFHFRLDA